MCSLVNAKSGGCAEDWGSARNRASAESETPMHAMMEPEQILEHARAAEARRRPPLLHGHPGRASPSATSRSSRGHAPGRPRDEPQAVHLDRPHERRPRQAAQEAGVQRVHHNVETAKSYYPEVSTTVRYEGRNSHRRRDQGGRPGELRRRHPQPRRGRPSSASRWPSSSPRSTRRRCRSTSSTRARARNSATATSWDPWEAVKWIAIFRLVLPRRALRLCGGRVENIGDLQPLAVKAGVNGVMMGNFLTTLGNTPEQDRQMFEDLGLDISRQPDNGSNPRPDNRSAGWRARARTSSSSTWTRRRGDAGAQERGVDVGGGALADRAGGTERVATARRPRWAPRAALTASNVRLWDPSTQLRYRPRKNPPPPRPDVRRTRARPDDARTARRRGQRPEPRSPPTNAEVGGRPSPPPHPSHVYPSSREELRADQRRRLLKAMATILAEDGFHGARIQDIAREAKVSLRTFYASSRRRSSASSRCTAKLVANMRQSSRRRSTSSSRGRR